MERPGLWHVYNGNLLITKDDNQCVLIMQPVRSKESCSQKLSSGIDITAWTGIRGSKHYPFILSRDGLSIVTILEELENGCFRPGQGVKSAGNLTEQIHELAC